MNFSIWKISIFCYVPADPVANKLHLICDKQKSAGDLYTESGQTLEGSFSAVSAATIARVGTFFQIFRDLQDFHPFAPLWTQNFNKKLAKILQEFR